MSAPLVSVMITGYDRPDELRETLRLLRGQTHRPLELLVVDDASPRPLEPVVREEWPDAVFWRNERNLGAHASRSTAMRRARGEFILTLDDDSNPVDPTAIERAVARFGREPELGMLAFHVHEGLQPPDPAAPRPPERYIHAFINCGQMMRTEVARQVGGYRDFFVYYSEEAEFALRVLDRGWRILFYPSIVVHHRMSPIGRSDARITAYNFRNTLWTVLLDLPFPRALGELGWKVAVNGTELIKQGNPRWAAWAVGSFVRGLPRVLRERTPISEEALRRYDALRFREIHSADELTAARPPSVGERVRWFRQVWMKRRRARAFWDRRPGGTGEASWTSRDDG